jgi:hypothetical protein
MDEQTSRHFPIREDMASQRSIWIIQRLGWVLTAIIPVLAVSGIFSNGVFSEQMLERPPLTISYERFQRMTALTRFSAQVTGAGGEEIQLRLSPSFQENYEIGSVEPRPSRSTASTAGLDLTFERLDPLHSLS